MVTMVNNGLGEVSEPTRVQFQGKYTAMFICWFLGLGSLFSWNSMLTIGDYYYQLFPNYHAERILTLVYQPFAFGTMGILAYNEANVDTRKRNLLGYILFFLSTFGLLVIDLATSGKGGIGNFIGICILVAVFGISDAHVEGGMVGDLSLTCPEFIQSFFAGMAASGALTSALRLVTKAVFDKTDHGLRKGVILFLAISTFCELVCILLYAFIFPKLPVVKFFHKKAANEGSTTVTADLAAAGFQTNEIDNAGDLKERLNNKQLIIKNFDYLLSIYLVYVLTLSIVPGFLYENTGKHQLGSWYAVVLIAMYNVWDLISRYFPLIDCIRMESRKWILVASMMRVVFIPCFYFTAKYGEQGWMILLISLLGLTNGYLTVCITTAAPKGFKAPEQNALGNLLVFFLLGGLFSGAALGWLWLIGHGGF